MFCKFAMPSSLSSSCLNKYGLLSFNIMPYILNLLVDVSSSLKLEIVPLNESKLTATPFKSMSLIKA